MGDASVEPLGDPFEAEATGGALPRRGGRCPDVTARWSGGAPVSEREADEGTLPTTEGGGGTLTLAAPRATDALEEAGAEAAAEVVVARLEGADVGPTIPVSDARIWAPMAWAGVPRERTAKSVKKASPNDAHPAASVVVQGKAELGGVIGEDKGRSECGADSPTWRALRSSSR